MLLCDLMPAEYELTPDWASLNISGLTADSRQVEPGFIFAALPGTVTDGARFVPQALAQGAVAIIAPSDVQLDLGPETALIAVPDPRRMLAILAARFYGAQPEVCVAVTGTNGKTSVVTFVRQIWQTLGHRAASLGTVGLVTPDGERPVQHTTPEPVALHRMLRELADDGIDHLAAEVSSHGLEQRRADGFRFAAAAFTNISRDHIDYHETFENYFAQKLRLFSELLQPGAVAVVNADTAEAARVVEVSRARGLDVWTVGEAGDALKVAAHSRTAHGHDVTVLFGSEEFEAEIPLIGDFQVSNALVAAGLVLATGASAPQVFGALKHLKGAKGRLDLVGRKSNGAMIFVDYAHTPDALVNALSSLRPFTPGRLAVVFGCGGDRDPGKRKQMGAAAAGLADDVYVTDDNPRTEDPAAIRKAALEGCPDATEIGDRAKAISAAIEALQEGDVLVVAGKGHESGQTIGTEVLPFSDHDVVRKVLGEGKSDA